VRGRGWVISRTRVPLSSIDAGEWLWRTPAGKTYGIAAETDGTHDRRQK
jgi:hypothetical protein